MAGLIGADGFGDDGVQEERHRDGSLRARGPVLDLDGTRLRSGHVTDGEPVGEWVTYDRRGQVHRTTHR